MLAYMYPCKFSRARYWAIFIVQADKNVKDLIIIRSSTTELAIHRSLFVDSFENKCYHTCFLVNFQRALLNHFFFSKATKCLRFNNYTFIHYWTSDTPFIFIHWFWKQMQSYIYPRRSLARVFEPSLLYKVRK